MHETFSLNPAQSSPGKLLCSQYLERLEGDRKQGISQEVPFQIQPVIVSYLAQTTLTVYPNRAPVSQEIQAVVLKRPRLHSQQDSPTESRTVSSIGVQLAAGMSTRSTCALPSSYSTALGALAKPPGYQSYSIGGRKAWPVLGGQRGKTYRNYTTFLPLAPYTSIHKSLCGSSLPHT